MSDRGAVFQFEIDRARVKGYPSDDVLKERAPSWKYNTLIKAALFDTFENGGTLVVVVSDTKITVVQSPDAEDLEPEETTP